MKKTISVFFLSILGKVAKSTDLSRSSEFAAEILTCTLDPPDFIEKKGTILSEATEATKQDDFVYYVLQNFRCVACSPNTSLLHIGTQMQNKKLFSVLNQLPQQWQELSQSLKWNSWMTQNTEKTLSASGKALWSQVAWAPQQRLCQFFSGYCHYGESWLHLQFQQQTYISFIFIRYQIIFRPPS